MTLPQWLEIELKAIKERESEASGYHGLQSLGPGGWYIINDCRMSDY
jgi:hypothetical protein